MRILLLNGAKENDQVATELIKQISDTFQDSEVDLVNLYSTEIAGCLGCFGCWIKTPGVCVIDDAGREMSKKVMASDFCVAITPITFGGYSYDLKKVYDRMIPIILPFFTKIHGEIHHLPRYDRYPKFITIGISADKNKAREEVFRTLVKRNATNLHSALSLSHVINRNSSLEEMSRQVQNLLAEAGVR